MYLGSKIFDYIHSEDAQSSLPLSVSRDPVSFQNCSWVELDQILEEDAADDETYRDTLSFCKEFIQEASGTIRLRTTITR